MELRCDIRVLVS